MIKVNGRILKQGRFGDGTLKADYEDTYSSVDILWLYDDDSELFTVRCVVDEVRSYNKNAEINLFLPYCPNARQDRYVSGHMFTLKTFCNMINEMGFNTVHICDPHSDVTMALLDRVVNEWDIQKAFSGDSRVIEYFDEECSPLITARHNAGDSCQIMYPDNGAAHKYGAGPKDIVGFKKRNREGRIESYELNNFVEGTKTVFIVDDIISYGGTVVSAAKELKKRGVEHVYVCVTHCEPNIYKGEVCDCVDKVFTTDSILDPDKDYEGYTKEKAGKIVFVRQWRERRKDEN